MTPAYLAWWTRRSLIAMALGTLIGIPLARPSGWGWLEYLVLSAIVGWNLWALGLLLPAQLLKLRKGGRRG